MRGKRNKLPVVLEMEEAKKLLELPNRGYPTGVRNKTIISIMLNMGLRVAEVAELKVSDVKIYVKRN